MYSVHHHKDLPKMGKAILEDFDFDVMDINRDSVLFCIQHGIITTY